MKLSMWIIYDFLKDMSPQAHITDGEPELTNVRILSDSSLTSPNHVYLTRAKEYIYGGKNNVICVHGKDMILLETEDVDMVFNRILDCFDYYDLWEEKCSKMIAQRCSLDVFLEQNAAFFRLPQALRRFPPRFLPYAHFPPPF